MGHVRQNKEKCIRKSWKVIVWMGLRVCFSLPYFTSTITIVTFLVLYLNSIKFTPDCRGQWFIMMRISSWLTMRNGVTCGCTCDGIHMWWLLCQFTLTTNTYYSAVELRRLSILCRVYPGIVSISWLSLGNSFAILAIWTRPCVLKHLSYPISRKSGRFSSHWESVDQVLASYRPLVRSSCLSLPSN